MSANETKDMTTTVPEPAKNKLAQLRDLFAKAEGSMKAVATRHLTPEKLTKVALVAIGKTPLLLQCDTHSILQAVMTSAQLGLDCSGVLGSAYLVPFKDREGNYHAQLILGYRGLIDLARRSGEIDTIEAHVVREKDEFEIAFGLDPKLVHVPNLSADPGPTIIGYAIARLKDGGRQVEVMTKAEIDRIRSRSRASGSGPWVTDYDEMAKKTVIRRLTKTLPLTAELAGALAAEDEIDGIISDVTPVDRSPMMMPKELPATTVSDANGNHVPVEDMAEYDEATKTLNLPNTATNAVPEEPKPQAPASSANDFSIEIVRKVVTKKREGKPDYYLIDTEGGSTICFFQPEAKGFKAGQRFRVTKQHTGTGGPIVDTFEIVP